MNNYKAIYDFAKKHEITFGIYDQPTEICPCMDLGLDLIDTDTFEMPCSFMVDRAIILNIPTPNDMTPEDTGESYNNYWDYVTRLREISRPQYIATDGSYIKLMAWCDWTDTLSVDPKKEFVDTCLEAINKTLTSSDDKKPVCRYMLDFRVYIGDVNLEIFAPTNDGIERMYDYIKNVTDFDCELYINYYDHAETADHGVRYEKVGDMKILTAY